MTAPRRPAAITWAATGTVTFAPGQLNKTISILIKGDKVKERNEPFIVTLYSPSNATISDPNGTRRDPQRRLTPS